MTDRPQLRGWHDREVDAVLSAAAHLVRMEMVFIGALSEAEFTFARILGDWPELKEGQAAPRQDSFCGRMLAGATPATSDAAADPTYRDVPARADLGITSYVGVPVLAPDGQVLGTLCGVDRSPVHVPEPAIAQLRDLADILAAHLTGRAADGVVIRRTPNGWKVENDEEQHLITALTLADLLADNANPPTRPHRPGGAGDEAAVLRENVDQLEHALAARVLVEQAIGVLAERFTQSPRAAFERLRGVARHSGRRVHELAREVVASADSPSQPLPLQLTRPRRPVPVRPGR
ncbi:MAG: GAF and ANTAR domain-containing protein [Mycobacteriales bacterium]